MAAWTSTSILDKSVSFSRRTTARLPKTPGLLPTDCDSERYDFLDLITAITGLYSQDGILEIQVRRNSNQGKYLGRSAISGVISVYTAITRPSTVISYQVKKRKHVIVLKKSTVRLFLPDSKYNNTDAIRGFILEIRILSYKALRDYPNIIKLLSIYWDCETVSLLPLIPEYYYYY